MKTLERIRRRSVVNNAIDAAMKLERLVLVMDGLESPPGEIAVLVPKLRELVAKYREPEPPPPLTYHQWGRFERDDRSCRGGD